MSSWQPDEMMVVQAARRIVDGMVCLVGIGLPSLAANLARMTHAPNCVLVYESGPIGAKPRVPPLSIGDGELAETADVTVSLPEIFAYWLQGGHIEVGFLGAAQIDMYANLNTTVIGCYERPRVRLPGAGGAPEIATCCRIVFVMLHQSPRTFVERVDFVTSLGRHVSVVVTDLGMLAKGPGGVLRLTHLHPGVSLDEAIDATGWDLEADDRLQQTTPPTAAELTALRALKASMHQSLKGRAGE